MTDAEYKEQVERIEKYNKYSDAIAAVLGRKNAIQKGIISILCANNKIICFDYLGEDFKEELIKSITLLLDKEIENIKKDMKKI